MNEVKKEYKVVIDRSKWRTGQHWDNATGKGSTKLLNVDGYSCCLGFICRAIDPTLQQDDLNVDYPNRLPVQIPCLSKINNLDGIIVRTDTTLTTDAISINDAQKTTVAEKEAALLALFAATPIELEFVGTPTPYTEERAVSE